MLLLFMKKREKVGIQACRFVLLISTIWKLFTKTFNFNRSPDGVCNGEEWHTIADSDR